MKTFWLLTALGFLLVSCSSTKITSTRHAGYRMHESLVISPLPELGEVENDQLMGQAINILSPKLLFLKIIPYQDAHYTALQLGLTLPNHTVHDRTRLQQLHQQARIQYILSGSIISLRDKECDTNSPYYKRAEAVLSFRLYDAVHQTLAWQCSIRCTVNPVGFNDKSVNVRGVDGAVKLAYRKAMKRLAKEFKLLPNRPA